MVPGTTTFICDTHVPLISQAHIVNDQVSAAEIVNRQIGSGTNPPFVLQLTFPQCQYAAAELPQCLFVAAGPFSIRFELREPEREPRLGQPRQFAGGGLMTVPGAPVNQDHHAMSWQNDVGSGLGSRQYKAFRRGRAGGPDGVHPVQSAES
jgi:hypothetical protein